jgi:hypothetical protein
MERWRNWIVGLLAILAIVGLVSLARGEPRHGEPSPPPAAAMTTLG